MPDLLFDPWPVGFRESRDDVSVIFIGLSEDDVKNTLWFDDDDEEFEDTVIVESLEDEDQGRI